MCLNMPSMGEKGMVEGGNAMPICQNIFEQITTYDTFQNEGLADCPILAELVSMDLP